MSEIGARAISGAIAGSVGPAVCAYLTAGYPSRSVFPEMLGAVAAAADVVEIGVPFTDPMADGLTIQRASRVALDDGVTFDWILDSIGGGGFAADAPLLLMGYYNPFLAHGLDRLGESLTEAGVSGLIVPDVPLEEADPLLRVLGPRGLGLVQLVTPTTPGDRMARLVQARRRTNPVTTKRNTAIRASMASKVGAKPWCSMDQRRKPHPSRGVRPRAASNSLAIPQILASAASMLTLEKPPIPRVSSTIVPDPKTFVG